MAASITVHSQIFKRLQLLSFSTDLDETAAPFKLCYLQGYLDQQEVNCVQHAPLTMNIHLVTLLNVKLVCEKNN